MVEELYYLCIDRMRGKTLEISEEYLLGCITLLKRRMDGRADRDRIRQDLALFRGINKYERELKLIVKMDENALTCLIASSVDLSMELSRIRDLFDRIKDADFNEDEAKSQATKARLASGIMSKIAQILKPKKRKIRLGNLFEGIE